MQCPECDSKRLRLTFRNQSGKSLGKTRSDEIYNCVDCGHTFPKAAMDKKLKESTEAE